MALSNSLKRVLAQLARGDQVRSCSSGSDGIRWVFLGPPGVGKGTFASRISESLGIAHIAAGDLVRAEMKADSTEGKQMRELVNQGKLVPDSIVLQLLKKRLDEGQERGERGFILDGVPRTRVQAEQLESITDVQLAVNLSLREDILVTKCLGRRMCSKCGKNYNLADIYFPAAPGKPEVVMPPLLPPEGCMQYMERRSDDTEEVIRRRLQVYHAEADEVEQYYREAGLLMDFEILTGLKETMPQLKAALQPYIPEQEQLREAHS